MIGLASSLLAGGCSPLPSFGYPEAYVGQGNVAEIRTPTKIPVWVRDAKSGEMRKAYVTAYQGWLVGPAAPTQGK